ncbi:MAG: LysM peptidoglycan-binding domain-containing protein [Parabacteroides sp.]|nr:LysM peptidoglycan-binding domain-containing protein [Parabacteroides sp.]
MNKIWICVFAMMFGWGFESQAQRDNTSVRIVSERDKTFSHTIERGQTVYAIATMYGVSTEDIYRLNPDSRNGIKAGDTLLIPQQKAATEKAESASATQNYTFHTIQKKETLYAVSMRYKVPATEIVKANPGLTTKTFTIGRTIRIPNFIDAEDNAVSEPSVKTETVVTEEEYKIARRETMYSLCKKFNISSHELIKRNPVLKKGVKAGTIIYVPVTKTEEVVVNDLKHDAILSETEVNALLDKTENIEKLNQIKVALLLPFKDGQSSHATSRFVEYYEGMLLAVDSLKNMGASISLSVYDTGTGTAKLNKILKEDALKESNLIIGAVQNDQIAQIAQFAETNQIKYVIPFTSKNDNVLSNSMIFQVNTPHSYLYSKAAQAGCELFAEDNIIIVNINDKDVKKDFITAFKTELKDKNIKYKEINYKGETFSSDILALMDKNKKNVVLPTSSSLDALQLIKTPLRSLAETGIEETDSANPENKNRYVYNISMFGYPEWQTYMREALEDFYVLDTYIYTNFYADNLSDRIHNFYNSYKYWYSKSLINTFPKYGILGFDTGMYFLGVIHKYGINFEKNIDKISYPSLQTGFDFHRVNNWGGFINTNVFVVHYKKDYTVTRDERK